MKNYQRLLWIALTILAVFSAFTTTTRLFTRTSPFTGEQGLSMFDFSCYWGMGHFIWQGDDPYRAFLEHRTLRLPIHYLDGPITVEGPELNTSSPANNTAPMVLFTALLSRLSWPTASTIWAIVNFGAVLMIAWLVMRMLHARLLSLQGILLLAVLLSMLGTRTALELGQTVLVILACMLAAIMLGKKHPLIAGVLLGFALSKYSLAFPAFLFFAYKRWYRGMAVSLAVQLLGVLAITAIGGTAPHEVVISYLRVAVMVLDQTAYDLPTGILAGLGPMAYVVVGIGSIGVFAPLIYWYGHRLPRGREATETSELLVFLALMLWDLLAMPHHWQWDFVVTILFVALVMLWIRPAAGRFTLHMWQQITLYIFVGLSVSIWSLPVYTVISPVVYKAAFDLCVVGTLGICIWLLFRIRPQAIGCQMDSVAP